MYLVILYNYVRDLYCNIGYDGFSTLQVGKATVLTVALMLQFGVRLSSSATLCIVAKWCVLEQKLLLTAYRKSYMRNRLIPK